jgi:hypothetical protein
MSKNGAASSHFKIRKKYTLKDSENVSQNLENGMPWLSCVRQSNGCGAENLAATHSCLCSLVISTVTDANCLRCGDCSVTV